MGSTTHWLNALGAPTFRELYLAMQTEVNTKFVKECWGLDSVMDSASVGTNNSATIKKKIAESTTHSLNPLGAPKFQLYLAMHTEVKTKFVGGVLGSGLSHSECICNVKNY